MRPAPYQRAALPLSYQRNRSTVSTPGRIRTGNLRGVSTALLAVELPAYHVRSAQLVRGISGPAWVRTTDLLRVEQALWPAELQARPSQFASRMSEKRILFSREELPAARQGAICVGMRRCY